MIEVIILQLMSVLLMESYVFYTYYSYHEILRNGLDSLYLQLIYQNNWIFV